MLRARILAVLALLILPSAIGQFNERIDVRVHELEVVVETRDGNPVADLQKDDFIVLQDGTPQEITNFSVVNESTATTSATGTTTTPGAARSAALPRKPRKFVFYLDEFAMHDATRKELLQQCAELVGVMKDGDEAMVVTPASPQRIPLFFTTDKSTLMTTLERVTGEMMRKGPVLRLDRLAAEPPSSPDQRVLLRGDCGQSPQKCAEERLGVLREVVDALGQLSGKKILVLMTTQMSSMPGLAFTDPATNTSTADPRLRAGILAEFRDLRPLVNTIGRTAAANNVLIYGLETYEPGNEALPGVTVEEGRTEERGNASLTRSSKRGQEGTQDLLLTLADTTGARAFSGTREAGEMFDRISQDLRTYYSIGYRDSETIAKDHRVEVRLRNHPELVVRTRRNVRTQTAEDEERGQAMAAVLSSRVPNPLAIRLTASPLVHKGRTIEIPVHVHIPLSHLTFAEEGGDKYRARFKVLVAAVGEHADFGQSEVEHAQDVVVPQSRWEAAQAQEFRYDTTVRVSPGRYRVAVGVTDLTSG
ncbi:MAG: VWA domain-containing protein, partial [Thermoanaerobaculia bacterium]